MPQEEHASVDHEHETEELEPEDDYEVVEQEDQETAGEEEDQNQEQTGCARRDLEHQETRTQPDREEMLDDQSILMTITVIERG